MSTTSIGKELRRQVVLRADRLCEYCLLHEDDSFFGFEVDHILSEKHGGQTTFDNLAYACLFCNRNKGSDIASLVPGTRRLTRLFNPRSDLWRDHFRYLGGEEAMIEPLTEVGEATARLLGINDVERRLERNALAEVDRYPTPAARTRMS